MLGALDFTGSKHLLPLIFSEHSLGFHSFVRPLSEWIATHRAVNHPRLQILRITLIGKG